MSNPKPQDMRAVARARGATQPRALDESLLAEALSGLASAVKGLEEEALEAPAVVDAAERLHAQIQKCLEEATR